METGSTRLHAFSCRSLNLKISCLRRTFKRSKGIPSQAEELVEAPLLRRRGDQHSDAKKPLGFSHLKSLIGRHSSSSVESAGTDDASERNEKSAVVVHELGEPAPARPDRAEAILAVLLRRCSHPYPVARNQAMTQLMHFMELGHSEKNKEIASALMKRAREDDVASLRSMAMVYLVKKIVAWPDQAQGIVEGLLPCASSADRELRNHACHLLGELIEWCPRNAREIAAMVFRSLHESNDERARTMAMRHLGKSATACPEMADEVVSLLLRLCNSRSNRVREVAMRQLAESVTACQSRMEDVVAVVLGGCSDADRTVRKAAVSQLGVLASVCPKKSRQIIPAIFMGCSDAEYSVRQAAMGQFAKAASAYVEWADVIVTKLLRSCQSDDAAVRALALRELAQATKCCPAKSRQIVGTLIQGCAEEDSLVSAAAKEHLEEALGACPDMAGNIVAALIARGSVTV